MTDAVAVFGEKGGGKGGGKRGRVGGRLDDEERELGNPSNSVQNLVD